MTELALRHLGPGGERGLGAAVGLAVCHFKMASIIGSSCIKFSKAPAVSNQLHIVSDYKRCVCVFVCVQICPSINS